MAADLMNIFQQANVVQKPVENVQHERQSRGKASASSFSDSLDEQVKSADRNNLSNDNVPKEPNQQQSELNKEDANGNSLPKETSQTAKEDSKTETDTVNASLLSTTFPNVVTSLVNHLMTNQLQNSIEGLSKNLLQGSSSTDQQLDASNLNLPKDNNLLLKLSQQLLKQQNAQKVSQVELLNENKIDNRAPTTELINLLAGYKSAELNFDKLGKSRLANAKLSTENLNMQNLFSGSTSNNTLESFINMDAMRMGDMGADKSGISGSKFSLIVAPHIESPAWGQSLNDRIMWMINNNMQRADIKLNPPQLGPLEIQVSVKNDQANILITSQHGVVREAVESALPRLRDMLNDSGFSLVNVDISDKSFQQNQTASNFDSSEDESHDQQENADSQFSENVETQALNSIALRMGGVDLFV